MTRKRGVKPSKINIAQLRLHQPKELIKYMRTHGNIKIEEAKQMFHKNKKKIPGV